MELKGNNITVVKGDSGFITLNFKEKCKPYDLEGAEVRFIIKKAKEDADSTAILDVSLNPQAKGDSFVLVEIPESVTNREPEVFIYGVRLTKGTAVHTVLEGNFAIEQGPFQ